MFFLLIAGIVIVVVPPVVWWSVTRLVPQVLARMGLLDSPATRDQEARLQRIEEAIDALATQVERMSQQPRQLPGKASAAPEDR
jgi:predicted PurR-regulated permease PerM